MKNIIGIAAQMQNGKDTVADYLVKQLNERLRPFSIDNFLNYVPWRRVAFAAGVKKVFSDTFGKDADFIETWKVKKEPPEDFKKTVRQALQFIGDGFREIREQIWVDLLFRTQTPPYIISDGRYINELTKVKENGGINILVWRPGFENDDPNGSEAQIRPVMEFFRQLGDEGSVGHRFENLTDNDRAGLPSGVDQIDYFIRNDGSIESLYQKIDTSLLPYLTKTLSLPY